MPEHHPRYEIAIAEGVQIVGPRAADLTSVRGERFNFPTTHGVGLADGQRLALVSGERGRRSHLRLKLAGVVSAVLAGQFGCTTVFIQ